MGVNKELTKTKLPQLNYLPREKLVKMNKNEQNQRHLLLDHALNLNPEANTSNEDSVAGSTNNSKMIQKKNLYLATNKVNNLFS